MIRLVSWLFVLAALQCLGLPAVGGAGEQTAESVAASDVTAVRSVTKSTSSAHGHRAVSREKSADEYYRAGVVAYIKGNNATALDKFSRALRLQPDHSLAKMQLDKIKQETDEKKLREAKDKYNQGLAFYMNGKLNEAISVWEKALVLDPYNTGVQKALDRARAEFRERNVP